MVRVRLRFLDPRQGEGVTEVVSLDRVPVVGETVGNVPALKSEGTVSTTWKVEFVLLNAHWVGKETPSEVGVRLVGTSPA